MFTVVPEFGAMVIIYLAITITVMIFLTTKKSNISLIK